MKEKILNLMPSSILDKVDSQFFIEINQEQHKSYIKSGNYYENYYALSSYYQPKSILEIGVRYGYSLGSMISASNVIEKVTGIDNDEYIFGALDKAKENIKKYINSNVELNFSLQNSHDIEKLEYHDIIHIDGDHSYDGKLKDLKLTIGACKIVIIDDYLEFGDVNKSTNDFISYNKDLIENTYVLDNHSRGTMIIEYK
jgi:predicted O-methyltransferase YrrM